MEKKSKKDILGSSAIDDMIDDMLSFYSINDYKNILDFAKNDIDLSDDVSSARARLDLSLTPYLIEPLTNAVIEQGKRKIITCCMPEQMGKTTLEMVSILYNCCYNKMQVIIVYPSLELATETSNTKFIPLFRKIKQFEADLKQPRAIRGDRLQLSNAKIYWQGAGRGVVSKSAKMVCGDECSIWETPGQINNIEELKKRTRSYEESLSLYVSTPTTKENAHWQQFLEGSQGYFFLKCPACGKHTIRSCDIYNLQFEKTYDEEEKVYVPVKGSCRLVCPECKTELEESRKPEMVRGGKYIHTFPDRLPEQASFQAGVLASLQSVHSWDAIASKQLQCGKSADYTDIVSWDHSYRGLPFQGERASEQKASELSNHLYDPKSLKPEDIEAIYVIADTQDEFSVVGVFALDIHNNYYLIDLYRPKYLWLDDTQRAIVNAQNKEDGKPSEITVLDMLNKDYYGIRPLMCLVDYRGHRQPEIKQFSRMQNNIIMYAGTSLKFEEWKPSENISRMMLVDAKKIQARLIWTLYFQKCKDNNYIYLPNTLTDKDIQEIISVQPDKEKRNGNLYENWDHRDKVHDVFDVLKMFFAALKISVKIYHSDKFRFCHAECLKNKKVKKTVDANSINKNTIIRKPLFGR